MHLLGMLRNQRELIVSGEAFRAARRGYLAGEGEFRVRDIEVFRVID